MEKANKPYRLYLKDSLYSCPQLWKNFIYTYNPNGDTADEMALVLKTEYNAFIDDDIHFAEFADESDFIMFKLRWSY